MEFNHTGYCVDSSVGTPRSIGSLHSTSLCFWQLQTHLIRSLIPIPILLHFARDIQGVSSSEEDLPFRPASPQIGLEPIYLSLRRAVTLSGHDLMDSRPYIERVAYSATVASD